MPRNNFHRKQMDDMAEHYNGRDGVNNKKTLKVMNEQKRDELEEKIRPVMKWLNENKHPHVKVIITPTNAELVEGAYSTAEILDYVRD